MEGLKMFRDADYMTSLGSMLELDFDEQQIGSQGSTSENMGIVPTGSKVFRKDFIIGLKTRFSFGGKKLEPRTLEVKEVKGKLKSSGYLGNVKIIDASFNQSL